MLKNLLNRNFKKLSLCTIGISFILTGCGKSLKNSEEDNTIRREGVQASELNFHLPLDDNSLTVELASNAYVYIPGKVFLKESTENSLSFHSKIVFNQDSSEELYCKYKNTQESSRFLGCYIDTGSDGDDSNDAYLNYNPGDTITMDRSSVLNFSVSNKNSTSGHTAQFILDIDWH